ncbi:MAG: hypothetical protein R6V47_04490 [Candidatus Delongbacteria bacterium]
MLQRFFAMLLIGIFVFSSQVFSLTEKDVEKFVKTTKELVPYFEELEEQEEEEEKDEDPEDTGYDIDDMTQEFAEAANVHGEIKKIIASNGYSEINDWTEAASKIFTAVASIEYKKNVGDFDESMKAVRKETEGMGLTEEQIEAYEEQVRSAMQQFEQAPESDIKAVEPYLKELREILEWE